jgi:hypothetical protein
MAASKSNKNWSEIFNAPKQSSPFGDTDLTIRQRHDSFTRFAKGKHRFSDQDFFSEPAEEKNPVAKAFKKLQRKFKKK